MVKGASVKYTLVYIASIVAVNFGFVHVPLLPTPFGDMWPPMSLAVGLVFVLRDFAQREIGHWVLVAMLIGAALSYVMATPIIAVASLVAFSISELVDWALYSFTKRPFKDRILISSIISTPIDSAVFLGMIGLLSATSVTLMTLSKLLAAAVIYLGIKNTYQSSLVEK